MGKTSGSGSGTTRREFILRSTWAGIGLTIFPYLPDGKDVETEEVDVIRAGSDTEVRFTVNKNKHTLNIDTRATLLDTLREKLQLTGTKKGCDHGQCGACTVLVNGRRVNSCLMLAAMCQQADVITIEGLAHDDRLHPMQDAFIKHDAFQCGYCTPGQICSAVGLMNEGHAKTDDDIRELMSGNICRCGAYQNITDAVREVINI